jgi:hypothetical protein
VSPLQTVTVPRLELCAAQLGARLLCHVLKENRFSKCPITAWSDSQVALAWIHGHPSRWKTFVANRVSYIQTSLPAITWRYVPSSDNPADVASRGTEPELLRDSPLWWHGPPWLSQSEQCWPKKVLQDVTSPGEEAPRSLLSNVARVDEEPWTLLSRYSSLAKLLRVTALCVRFFRRCRSRDAPDFSRAAEIRDAKLRFLLRSLFPLATAPWWAANGSTSLLSSHPGSTLFKRGRFNPGPRRNNVVVHSSIHTPFRWALGGRRQVSQVPTPESHRTPDFDI